jgi:PAS domain S-box-containing protein
VARFSEVVQAPTLSEAATVAARVLARDAPVGIRVLREGHPPTELVRDAGVDREVLEDDEITVAVTARCGDVVEVSGASRQREDLETVGSLLAAVADRDDGSRVMETAARFQALVDAAPDAIVVVDGDGLISSANRRCEELFGYPSGDLVGTAIEELVPEAIRGRHAGERARYLEAPSARPMAAGTDLEARHADGSLVPVDIALAPIGDAGTTIAAFARDAMPRRQAERDRRSLAESELRRRQALEVNDSVIQGLVTLLWQADENAHAELRGTAEATLASARRIMGDLLDDLDKDTGRLIRVEAVEAATTTAADDLPPHLVPVASRPDELSVVVADDVAALRMLLVMRLSKIPGVAVVGEASDGRQAVELVRSHRPAVILLDLSMPVLDGLQAARRIREESPGTYIIVVSGYPADVMAEEALEAGADEYHEKGSNLDAVCAAVASRAVSRAT